MPSTPNQVPAQDCWPAPLSDPAKPAKQSPVGAGPGAVIQSDAGLMSEAGAEPEPDLEAAAELEPEAEAVPKAELEVDAETETRRESEAENATEAKLEPADDWDIARPVEAAVGSAEMGAVESTTTIKLRPTTTTNPAGNAAARASSDALSSLSLPARLEAILYLKGRPLGLAELAEIAGIDRDQAEMALITLMTDYAHRDTALEIRQEGQRYSLQLRESLGDLVQSLLPVDLSTATLRTLATIALKKRILQSELVDLRGSGAYDHIKELLAQEFIERRRQSEGRSYWLSLSEKFHRTFAVSADDLGPRRRQAA